MQYYTERHRRTCGVDLHGRNLYLCVLDPDREIVLHRRVDCDEKKLLRGTGAVPGGRRNGNQLLNVAAEPEGVFVAGSQRAYA